MPAALIRLFMLFLPTGSSDIIIVIKEDHYMIEQHKSKKEINAEYREKLKLEKCEQIIALAKKITAEGGGDVKFTRKKVK